MANDREIAGQRSTTTMPKRSRLRRLLIGPPNRVLANLLAWQGAFGLVAGVVLLVEGEYGWSAVPLAGVVLAAACVHWDWLRA